MEAKYLATMQLVVLLLSRKDVVTYTGKTQMKAVATTTHLGKIFNFCQTGSET